MTAKRLLFLALSIFVPIAAVVLSSRTITWDGGFPQAEYRISFVDEEGKPVSKVTLEVRDKEDKIAYCYPVTDFEVDSTPVSDAEGNMVFHHIDLSPEFGGRCTRWLGLFSSGKCDPPHYMCIFLLSGKEVARFEYGETLAPDGGQSFERLPTVTRRWKKKAVCSPDLPDHLSTAFRSVSETQVFPVVTKEVVISRKAKP